MAAQRHIGLAIFGVCLVASSKLAFLGRQSDDSNFATDSPGALLTIDTNPLGVVHALRHYIFGLGVVGLLIWVEDYFDEERRRRQKSM